MQSIENSNAFLKSASPQKSHVAMFWLRYFRGNQS
jgi:hypothetical protein